jgi:U4/U6.U5 tri-snRNP-associated protein 1
LDSQDDVLVNVNLLDDERYKKNNEVKKQRPGYQPYDEEIDELTGLPKTRSMLAKYDEEIAGEQKTSFVIGMVFL